MFQLKAFDSAPHGTRKVVISTNIAEASITIPGIAYGMFYFCSLNLNIYSNRLWICQIACIKSKKWY
jgi:hypothetical protein